MLPTIEDPLDQSSKGNLVAVRIIQWAVPGPKEVARGTIC